MWYLAGNSSMLHWQQQDSVKRKPGTKQLRRWPVQCRSSVDTKVKEIWPTGSVLLQWQRWAASWPVSSKNNTKDQLTVQTYCTPALVLHSRHSQPPNSSTEDNTTSDKQQKCSKSWQHQSAAIPVRASQHGKTSTTVWQSCKGARNCTQ